MSTVERPHKVDYLGKKTSRVRTDITNHVISIDKFTDAGAGEIPSAQIVFNTDFGRFINSDIKFDQFDEFRITVTSPYDASDTYQKIMFLDELMPQTAEGGGYITTVQMYAREWYMTKVKMTGHYYFITFRDMVEEIFRIFNAKRGTSVPEFLLAEDTLEQIPSYTAGIFDFGYETSCYKALIQVLARLRQPVSGGGASEFFDMRFKEVGDFDRVYCEIFPFGSRTKGSVTTVLRGKDIDTQYISETKQNLKGTLIIARGRAEAGRYPKNLGLWSGIIEEMNNAQGYDSSIDYPKDSLVRWQGKTWRRTSVGGKTDPRASNPQWENAAFKLLNFDYSPWTANNAPHYANLGSTNSSTDLPSKDRFFRRFPDSNLVIKDGLNYRNWVDFRVSDEDQIPWEFTFDGTIPEDLRVLVDPRRGTLSSRFNGTDDFGNTYSGSFVQYRNGKWVVIHKPELYHECAVLDEGQVYAFGPNLGDSVFSSAALRLSYRFLIASRFGGVPPSEYVWYNMRPFYLGHDCFHSADEVTHDVINNHKRLQNRNLPNTTIYGDSLNVNQSAVKTAYTFGETDLVISGEAQQLFGRNWYDWNTPEARERTDAIIGADFLNKDSAYKYGWWTTLFYAPFPRKNGANAIGTRHKVGDIFKQPVLDLKNLNYTSGGNQGWGHDDSEDLGQITGIHFLFKFQYTTTGSISNIPLHGNQPFRVTMYDTEDNVWVQDFTYRFLGDTQQVILPISGFRIYRARNPHSMEGDDILHNILNPELRVLEIFETRKIKMITLQWQDSYEPEGRYSPFNANRYLINVGSTLVGKRPKFVGWTDAFGFIHPPISQAKLSGDDDNYDQRHVMPNIKDYPNVTNQSQLDKIAKAEVDLAEFRVDDYVVKTTGKCDLRAGDRVYLEDRDIIPYSVKALSVRKVNYTVNASDGPSGFVRHVTVQARINQPDGS